MPTATPQDVATELGRALDGTTETNQITWWIEGVERRITRRLGPIDKLDPAAVKDVVVAAVARRVRNPDGKRNERIDDYSYALDTAAAQPGLYITDEEWDLLTPTPVYDVPFTGSVAYQRGW